MQLQHARDASPLLIFSFRLCCYHSVVFSFRFDLSPGHISLPLASIPEKTCPNGARRTSASATQIQTTCAPEHLALGRQGKTQSKRHCCVRDRVSFYICMYVCIYVWMYLYMHVRMYVCIYLCMCVSTYLSMYICLYACILQISLCVCSQSYAKYSIVKINLKHVW